MESKYPELFKPIRIGSLELPNRIAMLAMGVFSPRLMNPDGSYTREGADYYIERAKGGTGLIITGLIGVKGYVNRPFITRDGASYAKNSRYLMDGVHKHGAKIFVQLTGGVGRVGLSPADPIAPSPMPNVWDPTLIHRAMHKEEIRELVAKFGEAARIVKDAGGDGVEIHAVHEGYLLDQFAIAAFNNRSDEYGGTLENRLRITCEIVHTIKQACGPDFPVMLRYSVRSYMKGFNRGIVPEDKVSMEMGRDLDEGREATRILERCGYDALDCDNGCYDAWYWAHPPTYMPKACNLPDVAAVKKAVKIPVICGGRFDDPELANDSIARGVIDMMGVGRPLLADPERANKLRDDRADDVRPCIACHMGCFGRIFRNAADGNDISCALNPQCAREESLALRPAQTAKKVLVAGGGIGGMEAARVCALRGQKVELHEKSARLGGALIPASAPEFKADDRRLIAWYEKQLGDLGVTVRLESAVDKDMIAAGGYDEIFVGTGARERTLDLEDLRRDNVYYAKKALLSEEIPGESALVIGGGLTGCEIAYDVARKGKKVTVVEATDTILNVYGLSAANYNMLLDLMDFHKVEIMKSAAVVAYNGVTATVRQVIKNTPNTASRAPRQIAFPPEGKNREVQVPAEAVIISVGYVSDTSLYEAIKADNVHLIGDAVRPGNVMSAVWGAYELASGV